MFVNSIMDSLAAGEADVALLEHVDIDSPLVGYASTLPSWMCSDHLTYPEVHRIRDMSGEAGTFLAGLSSHARYKHRQRVRQLTKAFPDNRIERFRAADEIARLMRDVESVAKRSYQRGLGVGFSETAHIESRLEFEARQGWLRAFVLYLDGKPRAFWIGSIRNQTFLSDFLGFDPDYAQYSPGMYLLMNALEEMSSDPSDGSVTSIDFGIGDAFYKERLSNRYYQEAPVYIFAPNMKAVGVNALRSAVGALNRLAKYSLRTMPWLANVKRKWRAKLAQND
ncbi:GNAT family N-acetyltransferase [Bradyrhizobium sp. CSA112]|uniref:GNAT family N-acetyltransferase n=1 Tax=Bradyrhizobium sp. CSA112 TaxID=2699170 RepID=UPI0023B12B0D|nr:GNAT family N-acetyltransferase [Bradyrhizobium sp. CSA112]MDE5452811.1 GNAT family N-acetyltransferase [Bradyrhizobium sp. CSA112]